MTPDQPPGDLPRINGTSRRVVPAELARMNVRDRDGITIVEVAGEVDLSNAGEIGTKLTALPNRAPGLIVDLRDTSYLDSTGLAVLCDLALRLRQRSQELVVVAPPATAPRRVLEITGLHTEITVVDELAPAITRLQHAATPES